MSKRMIHTARWIPDVKEVEQMTLPIEELQNTKQIECFSMMPTGKKKTNKDVVILVSVLAPILLSLMWAIVLLIDDASFVAFTIMALIWAVVVLYANAR